MKTKAKIKGRPPRERVELVNITFKADPGTIKSLDKLVAVIPVFDALNGRRSRAIRQAISDAAARLDAAEAKMAARR